MYINELFEEVSEQKVIVVFPGRFQIFHLGHKKVYDYLKEKFDSEVFITTSNKIDKPRSPFNFVEKVIMMKAAGIPGNRISMEIEPYRPINLLKKLDPHKFSAIFAVGEKDIEERFKKWIGYKKNGEPTYFQYLNDKKPRELTGFLDHGYIVAAPTVSNKRGTILSGTNTRIRFKKAYKKGPKAVDKLITELYGSKNVNNGALREVLIKLSGTGEITDESTLVGTYGRRGPKSPKSQFKGGRKVTKSKFKRYGSQKNVTKGQLVGDSVDSGLLIKPRKKSKIHKPSHVVPSVGSEYYILIKKLEDLERQFEDLTGPISEDQKRDIMNIILRLRHKVQNKNN